LIIQNKKSLRTGRSRHRQLSTAQKVGLGICSDMYHKHCNKRDLCVLLVYVRSFPNSATILDSSTATVCVNGVYKLLPMNAAFISDSFAMGQLTEKGHKKNLL